VVELPNCKKFESTLAVSTQ